MVGQRAAHADERAHERWKRLLTKNLQWARSQGVRRLVEEHELHPLRRSAAAARRARWRRSSGVAAGDARPVFLVGVQRSGTNMLARALQTMPEFEVYKEGDRAAFSLYRLRPDSVIRDIVARSSHRYVLFKPLCETHRIIELLDGLATPRRPQGLWAYRDVDGRVRSAVTKFGSSASDALRSIADGAGGDMWQAQKLSEDSLALIRSIDWDAATPADGAALLWYVRNRLFFELGAAGRPDVLLVSYDGLVRAPEETTRLVCRFLDVAWRPEVSAFIDRRSLAARPAVVLHPEIRSRCDALAAELDDAERAGRAAVGADLPRAS